MQRIGYIFFLIFIYSISFLPKTILYFISDSLAYILQYLVKYRVDLITRNLAACFPNRSKQDLETIKKQSYQNLADIILESLSFFRFKKKQYVDMYQLENKALINAYFEENRSVIVVSPHIGNWEGATSIDCQIDNQLIGLYKPIRNVYLDKRFKKRREKFGCVMESIKETALCFEKHKEKTCIYVMISDQSPSNLKKAYITNFLNRKTAFLKGPAKYAQKYNYPIITISIIRDENKRGRYLCKLGRLIDNPNTLDENEILETIAQFYEKEITVNPGLWLWSHNRWKKDLSSY